MSVILNNQTPVHQPIPYTPQSKHWNRLGYVALGAAFAGFWPLEIAIAALVAVGAGCVKACVAIRGTVDPEFAKRHATILKDVFNRVFPGTFLDPNGYDQKIEQPFFRSFTTCDHRESVRIFLESLRNKLEKPESVVRYGYEEVLRNIILKVHSLPQDEIIAEMKRYIEEPLKLQEITRNCKPRLACF
jgi:hypothetical protein